MHLHAPPLILKTGLSLALLFFAGPVVAQTVLQSAGTPRVYQSDVYSYEQGWTYSIFTPQVQKELEIVDQQLEDLKKIRADFYKEQQALYKEMYANGSDALAREEVRERVAALREKMTKQLTDTLLPHQVKRAKEVWLQTQTGANFGGLRAFSQPGLRELLGITPEQHERMTKRSRELNAEISQKYLEMRAEAAKKLLEELTPAQRKKLAELSGEKYEPAKIDYRKQSQQKAQKK